VGTPEEGFNHLSGGKALNYPSTVIWPRTVSHSKVWEPGIGTPQGQLLLSMSSPVGTDIQTKSAPTNITKMMVGPAGITGNTSQGGLPSMSPSTMMVGATGPTGNTSQAPHRCLLQQQWWMLPDPPAAPSRGPAIDVSFNNGGERC
jgi:hypothetical protein